MSLKKQTLKEEAQELRDNDMRCNCDIDNWKSEQSTGHSCVCRIHKLAVSLKSNQFNIEEKQKITKSWSEYPVGTKAWAASGGYWIKTGENSWKWCTGSSFPTPGGDAILVSLPK